MFFPMPLVVDLVSVAYGMKQTDIKWIKYTQCMIKGKIHS